MVEANEGVIDSLMNHGRSAIVNNVVNCLRAGKSQEL